MNHNVAYRFSQNRRAKAHAEFKWQEFYWIMNFPHFFLEKANEKSEAFVFKRSHSSSLKQQYVKPSGCWKLSMSRKQ